MREILGGRGGKGCCCPAVPRPKASSKGEGPRVQQLEPWIDPVFLGPGAGGNGAGWHGEAHALEMSQAEARIFCTLWWKHNVHHAHPRINMLINGGH